MSDPRYRPAYPSDAGTYAGSHPSSNAGAYGADDVGYPAQAGPYVYGGAPQPMDPYRNYGYAPHGPPGAYYSPEPPYAPDALSQRRYPPSAPMYSAMGFQGAPTGNMYHVPPPYPFGRVAYSDAPRMHGHGAQHDMSRPGALGPDANRPPPPAPPGAKNDHQMTSGPVAHRVPGSRGGWQRGRARGRASHAASHRASLPVASDAVCCHFLREMCHYGPRCRFSHADHGQGCCYGAQCRYGHGERPQSTALGADGPDSNTVSVAAPPDADQGITSVSVDGVVDAPAQDGDGSGVNADPIPPQQ